MLVFDPARGDPGLINSMTLRKNPIASSIFAEHEELFDSVFAGTLRARLSVACTLHE